jgi:hypothetical protein
MEHGWPESLEDVQIRKTDAGLVAGIGHGVRKTPPNAD